MIRKAFTLFELLISITVVVILVSITLTTLKSVRSLSRDLICQNNLKQTSTALYNYTIEYKSLPPVPIILNPFELLEINPQIGTCPESQLIGMTYICYLPTTARLPYSNAEWRNITQRCLDNSANLIYKDAITWHNNQRNAVSLTSCLKKE